MSSYDSIAPFYDKIHGSRRTTVKYVKRLLKSYHANAKSLLSVGCGTGSVCKVLAKRYQVTGIDISKEMLIEAKKKMSRSEFYWQDMRHLSLESNFDIIVSLFGVINHLLEFTEWEAFFKRVRDHLNPGGIFVFDILSELCLCNLIINSPLIIRDGKLLTICEVTTDEDDATLWSTKGYHLSGHGQQLLFNNSVRQTSFAIERILAALRPLFSKVDIFDPEHSEVSERSELLYFVCQV